MQLKDICCAQSSNIALKDLKHNSGPYPIYGASGFITCVDFFKVDKPYVGVVKDGAGVGRVMLLPEKSSVIGTMQSIIPTAGTDAKYLSYLLDFLDLGRFCSGATIPHIYFKDYGKETIPTHSPEQQQEISAALDKITKLIALRQGQLAKLDQLAKSRFIEMFGKKEFSKRILIDLIEPDAGLSYGIVQPGDDGTGDMGVLRPIDLVDGGIATDSIKYIDRSIGDGYKRTELTGKEILISVRGTTGITAITDSRFAGMNVTRGIAVIRFNTDKVNPVFLNAAINEPASQTFIQEHTRGATLKQINLSDLRQLPITLPPLELQNEFAAFIEQLDKSKLADQIYEVAA